MNIQPSFTGIHNLAIKRKVHTPLYTYVSPTTGKETTGPVDEYIAHINVNLSNDASGEHLNDFLKFVQRYGSEYLNDVDQSFVKLSVQIDQFRERGQNFLTSTFFINDRLVPLEERKDLGAMEYIAKLTRQISGLKTISPAQKENVDLCNSSVQKMAEYFIENML